jgi:hypothetical protein
MASPCSSARATPSPSRPRARLSAGFTDHNLLIRRNGVTHIELRGDTTDFKQPITRQDHIVWDNANTPRSLGQNGYQQLPSGWIIQWGFAASWGLGRWHHHLPHRLPGSVPQRPGDPPRPRQPVLERAEPYHHQLRDPHLIRRQQRLLVARNRPLTRWRRP